MINPATQPADSLVFDRVQIRRNRIRARPHLGESGFLIEWTAQQLCDRLGVIQRDFPTALQIGTRNDFTGKLSGTKTLHQMDVTHAPVIAEEDALPFAGASLDMIISALNFHSVNDLPGALVQMRCALKPDGLLLAGMMGGESLHELRTSLMEAELSLTGGVSPRVAPFADKQDMGALLQRAGFALPVIDSDIVTVTYDNMFGLLKDLRLMGEGNAIAARDKRTPPRKLFMEAAKIYQEKFAEDDGRIRATFEIIFLLGWAPHDSQQKPLKPGSAQTRLADMLGTDEHKVKQ